MGTMDEESTIEGDSLVPSDRTDEEVEEYINSVFANTDSWSGGGGGSTTKIAAILYTALLLVILSLAGYGVYHYVEKVREKREFDAMAMGAREITQSFEMTGRDPEQEIVFVEDGSNGSADGRRRQSWLKTKMGKKRREEGGGAYIPPSDAASSNSDEGGVV